MKRDDPTIVSLESHRRAKLAAKRKPAPHPPVERAINWRRMVLFLAAVVLFLVLAMLARHLAGALSPFR